MVDCLTKMVKGVPATTKLNNSSYSNIHLIKHLFKPRDLGALGFLAIVKTIPPVLFRYYTLFYKNNFIKARAQIKNKLRLSYCKNDFKQSFISNTRILVMCGCFFGEYSNWSANEGCLTHFLGKCCLNTSLEQKASNRTAYTLLI